MIAIHSKSKETLVQAAKRAIGNAHSNSSAVEWYFDTQKVIVNQDSSLETIIKDMKLKQLEARLASIS